MLRSLIAATAMIAVFSAAACNNAELTGTAKKRTGLPQPAAPVVPGQPSPPATPAPSPKPTTPAPNTPNPNPQPQVPGQPPVITEPPIEFPPDPTPGPNPPGVGSDIDTGSGPSFIDIIGGLLKVLTDVQIDQPNENEVIFGGNKVFHIGDGEFASTSECAAEIDSYRLKGTRYFFEFEVLGDATTINASIGKICGVDYNESNSVFLQNAASNLEQLPISKAQTTATFQARTLNKGKYTILVESRAAGAENRDTPNDHDDYIVGLVKISADKPIKPGRVGARP